MRSFDIRSRLPKGRGAVPGWCVLGVSCVSFLWFFHVIFGGIFNIGNIAGMALSLLPGAAVLFRQPIGRLWKKTGGKILLTAVLLAALAGVGVAAAAGAQIISAARNAPPAGADGDMVVLGALVRPGPVPSKTLRSRIDAAEKYLNENPDCLCVLSGGQGPDEEISEAECMYRELTARGVSPDRLLIEDRSTSTEENLAFSAKLLRERGRGKTVFIVTSEYHQYRAKLLARKEGLTACAVSARTSLNILPTYVLREILGIVYTKVKG
ncbi:MAG: YdcF family protein [Clostridia bacterium]|nr:YdcF family protein [Clostridia bacterium]